MKNKNYLVAVVNKSGNVGKTTLASCLIAPRLKDLALVAYIESTNHIPSQIPAPIGVVYGAHEFGEVENELLNAKRNDKSMLIDFGASDFNTTLEMLSQYVKFKDAVDLFVVPCTPGKKEQIDTGVTIATLIDLGIDPKKIRVIFNQVMMRDKASLSRVFSEIFKLQKEYLASNKKTFVVDQSIVMFQAEIFKRLGDKGLSLADVLADSTDFEAAVLAAKDEDEKFALSEMDSIKGLADNTNKTLDKVFAELMKGV